MPIERFSAAGRDFSIVGTGHVLKESMKQVREEFDSFVPEAVAIELDMNRFLALTRKTKRKPRGIVERLLLELQLRAGKTTGVKPGSEMICASEEASKHRVPVILIDRDIRVTLSRALRNMTLSEKAKLFLGVIGGFFEVGDKRKIEAILSQKDELMLEFKKELPGVYRALVTERDEYMAAAIKQLPYTKVLIVVGAGHMPGIRKKLEYWK